MVSVAQLHPQSSATPLASLAEGLAPGERDFVARALEFAEPLYAGHALSTGEPVWPHALGLASSLAAIGVDPVARAAGVLFAAPKYLAAGDEIGRHFGAEIAALAAGVERLYQLRVLTRATAAQQSEALRKMVLGMVEDVRVVLIRLASRTQTLRWFAKHACAERAAYARETLDIYAPLANRLGVWQLKWELEDLSFRFLEPETYKRIARMLDERRVEREQYIAQAMATLARELAAAGVAGEVSGRPKHIYSIWNKMRLKGVDFEQLHDVRALRVIVPEVQRLLCRARRGAQPVAADRARIRRLHLAAEGQPVPVAAHRGARARRQDAGGADPHARDAPPRRARRSRALALQGVGARDARRHGARRQDRVAAPAPRLARRGGGSRHLGRAHRGRGAR